MGDSDVGDILEIPGASDKTVQVDGTFSSVTVVLQGSNDGISWFTLTDPQGNNISFTAAGMETVMENPRFVRPSTSGGSSASVNVRLLCRSTMT